MAHAQRTDNAGSSCSDDEITTYTDIVGHCGAGRDRVLVTVDVERAGDVVVLDVAGELDAATADVPVDRARHVLAEGVVSRLVVDLADVTFLGSSGIGALVRIRNLSREHGVTLTLRGLRSQARKLLVLTGLDDDFGVATDTTP